MASSHLHHLVLKAPSSSSPLLKPLSLSLTLQLHKSIPPPRPRFFCHSSSSSAASSITYPQNPLTSTSPSPSPFLLLQQDDKDPEDEFRQQEEEEDDEQQVQTPPIKAPPPPLTIKEKKELAAYAHSLGKKLKIQQVGKSGVTDSVAASFVENLESNELLKLKIHNSCPGELSDVIKQLEASTGSVAVGQIGRSVILYRPSLTKLRAEEKKRQNQRVIARRGFRPKPREFRVKPAEFRSKPDESMDKRGAAPRFSSGGFRGRSRSKVP